jgi:DNA-binding transcriptional ArsR family regulator
MKQPRIHFKTLATHFAVVGDAARLRILCTLMHDGEGSVSAIAQRVRATVPVTSHHLRVLEQHHIVVRRKDGVHRYYSLASNRTVQGLVQYICSQR